MKNKVSYKQMLDNCEPDDLDQLHDIMTMMASKIDEQQSDIESLKGKMKRVNDALPSTAEE